MDQPRKMKEKDMARKRNSSNEGNSVDPNVEIASRVSRADSTSQHVDTSSKPQVRSARASGDGRTNTVEEAQPARQKKNRSRGASRNNPATSSVVEATDAVSVPNSSAQ